MGVTIKDVAQRAGVSIATVSRVINDSKPVSPELKKKILDIIEETGYKPNALARGLIKKNTSIIGIIIPDIANLNLAEVIKGIEGEADKNNFDIIVSNSHALVEKELEIFDVFREKQLDGILFSGVYFSEKHQKFFERYRIPIVVIGQHFPGVDLPSVTINNFQAAYEATSYLIQLGHKEIGMITGPLEDMAAGRDRYRGFSAALEENGLQKRDEYFAETSFTIRGGYAAMEEIFKKTSDPPTAIFAGADSIAIGAMNCCFDAGLEVPQDISIIGFDDNILASAVRPPLTTISINHEEIGVVATGLLLDKIKGNEKGHWNVQVPYRLVVRQSTCKLNQ